MVHFVIIFVEPRTVKRSVNVEEPNFLARKAKEVRQNRLERPGYR